MVETEDVIEVVDYSPRWPLQFESVAIVLRQAVSGVPGAEVEHVGSTAVPGLPAKPILDIDVIVDASQVWLAVKALEAVGYRHRGDLGLEGREAFFAPDDTPHRNVYVCRRGGLQVRNHLAVRDMLRARPGLAIEYGRVKRRLAERAELTIDDYIAAKSEVLQRILEAAGMSDTDRAVIDEANGGAVRTMGQVTHRPEAFDRVAVLGGRTWVADELDGGLSNAAHRVRTTDGEPEIDLVVRSWREAHQLVPIDRDVEHRATAQAGRAGIGPSVVEYRPDEMLMATSYVEGRALTPDDLRDPATLTRVAETVRQLHGLPILGARYDLFAMIRRYADLAVARGEAAPAGWLEQRQAVGRIEAALAVRPERLVPAHNDLVPANMIDTGDRIVLIDFEYAGDNEPSCELAILAAGAILAGEPGLDDDATADLVAAYGGGVTLSRVRLWRAVVDHGWAIWAALHEGFTDMPEELAERAARILGTPELERLLQEVTA